MARVRTHGRYSYPNEMNKEGHYDSSDLGFVTPGRSACDGRLHLLPAAHAGARLAADACRRRAAFFTATIRRYSHIDGRSPGRTRAVSRTNTFIPDCAQRRGLLAHRDNFARH